MESMTHDQGERLVVATERIASAQEKIANALAGGREAARAAPEGLSDEGRAEAEIVAGESDFGPPEMLPVDHWRSIPLDKADLPPRLYSQVILKCYGGDLRTGPGGDGSVVISGQTLGDLHDVGPERVASCSGIGWATIDGVREALRSYDAPEHVVSAWRRVADARSVAN